MKERRSFFDSFNSEFSKQLPSAVNYRAAYEAASDMFQRSVGIAPYSSYETFKSRRSQERKRSKKRV